MHHTDPHAEGDRLRGMLRDARLSAGLRQSDVAERLAQPQSYVSKYESGERRLDFLELRAVLSVLGVRVEDFVRKFEEADAG